MPRAVRTPGPRHPITVEPTGARVVVRAGGSVLADTTAALTLREASYPPVQYVPLADVDAGLLRPSTTRTWCPYKGEASYYSVAAGEADLPDAVWTYAQPHPAVAPIAGHVAFYPDRVDVTVG